MNRNKRKPFRSTVMRNRRASVRQRGVGAILAMMFLVIFASLAAAMAIVAQGNLSSADSHLKVNRSLAAAETGMQFVIYRLNRATATVLTRDGLIDQRNAPALWEQTRTALMTSFSHEFHNIQEPREVGLGLHIGPIAVGPGAPQFEATITPHPLPGENYDSDYYRRAPFNQMRPAVSSAAPLGPTWIRVRVEAADGSLGPTPIRRAIQMDFRLDKKIRFAVLSRSRVMIGRNVMIQGPIGSRFTETNLANGHPIQMQSDFAGLDSQLDAQLRSLANTLITNDANGDNRLDLANAAEVANIENPSRYDVNGDGYIDDFDFFQGHFDTNSDGQVSASELGALDNIYRAQLLELIDTFGDPTRRGHGDGVIDRYDRYAKVQGQILVTADMMGWNQGAAGGAYQNYFNGPIRPDYGQDPLTFEASDDVMYEFGPSDFDMESFRSRATGDLAAQAAAQAARHNPSDPNSPSAAGQTVREEVPYGAAHPYDFYDRPVYENMTFTNVRIPPGANPLFRNCTFIGCTFVETSTANTDINFNYAGTRQADGTYKYPNVSANVNGQTIPDTKTVSNNVRFDGCNFEGSVVTDAAPAYTHTRNKVSFTGQTQFNIENSTNLSPEEKDLYQRSTILAPQYSVEMGTFTSPADAGETVELTGTIVAGVLDVRGQVDINGTILTTFEPHSNEGPVVGFTSPQFNTTLGYFPSAQGDLEAEMPVGGLGVIHIRYSDRIPLPDGILGPIEIRPVRATYFEVGVAGR